MEDKSIPTKARLRWQCRRGMKELDVLLCRYLDERYELAGVREQGEFHALLDCEDPDLFAWLSGRADPEGEGRLRLVRLLRGDAG
ncbi:MAG: succinate dehydrogenase assembly factor 2 [Chromatiales bacterium]|nr:succinate dehydrogenase assembly factor 2 [Chromatiales bacterium]